VLKPEDIRVPGKQDDETEGKRELSWIWLAEHGERKKVLEVTEEEIGHGMH